MMQWLREVVCYWLGHRFEWRRGIPLTWAECFQCRRCGAISAWGLGCQGQTLMTALMWRVIRRVLCFVRGHRYQPHRFHVMGQGTTAWFQCDTCLDETEHIAMGHDL